MRHGRMLTFWLAVGGVSLISPVVFRLAAQRLPFQSLKQLDAFVTNSN